MHKETLNSSLQRNNISQRFHKRDLQDHCVDFGRYERKRRKRLYTNIKVLFGECRKGQIRLLHHKGFLPLNILLRNMPSEKPEILAVHKQKLEEFLRELELWESPLGGELTCIVCGTTITMDNIGFIIPSGEDIVFCCSNPECIYRLRKTREDELEHES